MEIELDTKEIYENVYDFLLEKGLVHTAFVLKNEAQLQNNNFTQNEDKSSLFTLYAKGKLFEQYEMQELENLDSDAQSISNQGFQNYVDQRILKSYNIKNQIPKENQNIKKLSAQSLQECDKKPQLETHLKYLTFNDYVLAYDRSNGLMYYFNFVDETKKNFSAFTFNTLKGKFLLFKHLCVLQKQQIIFIQLENFKFQKQITLKENNQIQQLSFCHNKYILVTDMFTMILNSDLENELIIPKKIRKVVASLNSLYLFSGDENLLYEYQPPHKRLLQIILPQNHQILNCSANSSSNILVVLSQNEENQNIYSIYHEGQETFLIQWRIKKFLSKIRVYKQTMIIFDDQTFHYCDFFEQQVKFRHSFKNHQIEDIYWIDENKILLQLAGEIFKKFDLVTKQLTKIEKTSTRCKIIYSEKTKKLIEIENPDMFTIINL